jgi:hypothetical protein
MVGLGVATAEVAEDLLEDQAQLFLAAQPWCVAGSVLQGVGDEDPMGQVLADAGWLQSNLEL